MTNYNDFRVVLELGARDLCDTSVLAKRFPSATLYPFECNPYSINICKVNFELMPKDIRDRVFPQYIGLNSHTGKCNFYPTDPNKTWNIGTSSMTKFILSKTDPDYYEHQDPIEIDCTRLDDWCKNNKIEEIDYIKSDIEGFDLLVILTLEKLLYTVKELQLEAQRINDYEINTSPEEARKQLSKYGLVCMAGVAYDARRGDMIFKRRS